MKKYSLNILLCVESLKEKDMRGLKGFLWMIESEIIEKRGNILREILLK